MVLDNQKYMQGGFVRVLHASAGNAEREKPGHRESNDAEGYKAYFLGRWDGPRTVRSSRRTPSAVA
jgi:hypothetical protein